MKGYVKWSKEERGLLFAEAYHVQIQSGPMVGQGLWRKAQEVLPPERRRAIYNYAMLQTLREEYEAWKTEWKRTGDGKPPMRPNRHDAPAAANGAAHPPINGEHHVEVQIIHVEVPVFKEPEWGKIPTAELARELIARLNMLEDTTRKFDALVDVMKARMEVEAAHRPNAEVRQLLRPILPSAKPIRVVVIGLDNPQFQELQQTSGTLPKPVELRWLDKEARSVTVPITTDYVICARGVAHDTEKQARDVIGKDRVFHVPGGKEAVTKQLFDICSRQSHPRN